MIKTYKPNDTARIEAMLIVDDMMTMDAALKWAGDDLRPHKRGFGWEVKTLEGWVDMPYFSLLIRGTSGEFYPCDPDIFEKRWVEVV